MSERLEVNYDLSPWGKEFLLSRENDASMPCYRQTERTRPAEELRRALGIMGLPCTDAILEFEDNFGGWSAVDTNALWGIGVHLSLHDAPKGCAVAERFRRANSWFAPDLERRNGPESWSYLPFHGTGYPRAFYRERPLVPVGMTGEEHVYFLGEHGEVYMFVTTIDQLSLVAGSGRTLIERWGLNQRKRNQAHWEVHFCEDVGAQVADILQVPKFDPASDEYFTVWANDEAQIRLVHDAAPNIFGTHISTREPAGLLRAAREVHQSHRSRPLRLWASANNIADLGGRGEIANSGIDVEVLFGPGPGNYDSSVDPDTGEWTYAASTYDSSDLK